MRFKQQNIPALNLWFKLKSALTLSHNNNLYKETVSSCQSNLQLFQLSLFVKFWQPLHTPDTGLIKPEQTAASFCEDAEV